MIGFYPERVKNLYFIYALVLKAVLRAEPSVMRVLSNDKYNSERLLVREILHSSQSECQIGDLFNETYFITGIADQ